MEEDLKKNLLQAIAGNDRLLEALREELISSLDTKKLDLAQDNENLGAEVRARERAKEMVEAGLKKIKTLKTKQQGRNQELNPGK